MCRGYQTRNYAMRERKRYVITINDHCFNVNVRKVDKDARVLHSANKLDNFSVHPHAVAPYQLVMIEIDKDDVN